MIDLNGSAAHRRAGYRARGNSAEVKASRLLRSAQVKAAVAERQRVRLAQAELSAARVLEELRSAALSDPAELFDEDGRPRRLWDMPAHARAALSSLEVTKRNLTVGDGKQEDVVKLRLWDKTKALELLARHLGLLVERVSVEDEAVSGGTGGRSPARSGHHTYRAAAMR